LRGWLLEQLLEAGLQGTVLHESRNKAAWHQPSPATHSMAPHSTYHGRAKHLTQPSETWKSFAQ
jgi:hypothetical protein